MHRKDRSTAGDGAWGKDLELAQSGEAQIFLACSGFLTTLHVTLLKGNYITLGSKVGISPQRSA